MLNFSEILRGKRQSVDLNLTSLRFAIICFCNENSFHRIFLNSSFKFQTDVQLNEVQIEPLQPSVEHSVDIRLMEDEVYHDLVDRAAIRSLSLKRHSAGLSVLDILQRKKNVRLAADFIAALLDSSYPSDQSDDSDEDEEEGAVEKDDILELAGYVFLKKVIEVDEPLDVTTHKVIAKNVIVKSYADEQCWSQLQFRKLDLIKLIDLLKMPPFFFSLSRQRFPREFSVILLLWRIAYPGRLHDLKLQVGRAYTQLQAALST